MKKLLNKTRSHHRPLLKFNLKMKLSALLTFVVFFTLQANTSYSQKAKISLDLNNVTVSQLIDKIESTTEFRFVYKIKDVNLNRSISINVEKESINTVLNQVFLNTKTSYSIVDRQIFLLKKEKNKEVKQVLKDANKDVEVQAWTVKGLIIDAYGQPLPGASVLEKGTTNGAQTDFDGNFSLSVSNKNAILLISYVGFVSQEIPGFSEGHKGEIYFVVNNLLNLIDSSQGKF